MRNANERRRRHIGPAPAVPRAIVGVALALIVGSSGVAAQEPDGPGWEVGGVPALGYDSDEGYSYGVLAEIYRYGAAPPYRFTVQPTVLFTTRGRRDLTVYFDAPNLVGRWRVSAFVGRDRHVATPWYGVGNATSYDETLDASDGPDPYYYRYGRTRTRGMLDVQRPLGASPLRLLVGAGSVHTDIDLTPHDEGTTLLAAEVASGATPQGARIAWGRLGLVWDTRDREIGPSRGVWTEVLVQRVDELLGSDVEFTRWTITDRRYYPLATRLVLANRLLLQNAHGDPPFHELQIVQTSARPQEGLGGSRTVRGLPKNRYAGEAFLVWNVELRWRAFDLDALGRSFHVVLSGFADSGRTWAGGLDVTEALQDLHHGFGGGVRVGMGESFVGALDVGHSSESTAPFYVGLGYLF